MNSQDSQKRKRWSWGITSILIGSTAVILAATNIPTPGIVKAEQSQPQIQHPKGEPLKPTAQSQIMPQRDTMHQGDMMMQGMMMAGEKADRHFIEMMIPHHEGAVQMADLALKLSKHPEIKKLAESIKSSQTNEIKQMKSWYKQWYGVEVSDFASNHRGMVGWRNSMGMQNMMTADLKALETAPDFDRAFIKQMIPHHKMALMMSSMIIDSDRPEMRTLSTAIVQAQSTEIEQMRQWYKAWYK